MEAYPDGMNFECRVWLTRMIDIRSRRSAAGCVDNECCFPSCELKTVFVVACVITRLVQIRSLLRDITRESNEIGALENCFAGCIK